MGLKQIFEPLWNTSGGEENHLVFEMCVDGVLRLHTSILSTGHDDRIRLPLCLHADMSAFYRKAGMEPFLQRIQWCSEQDRTVEYVSESAWGRKACYAQIRMVPYRCMDTRYVRVSIKMLKNRTCLDEIEQRVHPFEYDMIGSFEDPLCVFDVDENDELICVVANEPFGRIFGQTSRRMHMMPTDKLFDEPTALHLAQYARLCLRQCKPIFYQMRFDYQGRERYWRVRFTPFFGKTRISALCVVREITQRVLQCKRIEELEQAYERFLHMTTDGFAILQPQQDGGFHIQKCNERFGTFFQRYQRTGDRDGLEQWLNSLTQNATRTVTTQERGKKAYYKLCAQPQIVEGQIVRIFLSATPTTRAIDHAPQACAKLTAREAEVLALVVEGNTNRYIAHKLAVKEGTIKRIVSNGYRKLGIASRAELVRYVLCDQQAQLATL